MIEMMPWIIDGAVLVILLFFILRDYKEGFIASLIRAASKLVSLLVAYVGCRALAEACWRLFIKNRVTADIQAALHSGTDGLNAGAEAVAEVLPDYVKAFLAAAGKTAPNLLSGLTGGSVSEIANAVTQQAVYPAATFLMQCIFFFLLFVAAMIILKSLEKFFSFVRKIPLVGGVNALLGAVLGLGEGIVLLAFLVVGARLLLSLTGGWEWFDEPMIRETLLFKRLYFFNFTSLTTLFAG